MIDVTSLADTAGADVAQVLTDALLDAPGWSGIGPDRERHRRLVMWHYHRMLYRKALRWGRPGYAAWREGRLVGVAVVFDSDGWPLPEPISTLLDVPAFALAGLSAAVRGARAGATMQRAHVHEPHLYFSQLSVDPSAQRSRSELSAIPDRARRHRRGHEPTLSSGGSTAVWCCQTTTSVSTNAQVAIQGNRSL